MGLDMYLMRTATPSEQQYVDAYNNKPSGVLYWRKFNALHKYLVDNSTLEAGGTPDVGRYIVNRDVLEDFLTIADKVLKGKPVNTTYQYNQLDQKNGIKLVEDNVVLHLDLDVAKDLLPTQSGFFFGPTEYDYWYQQSVASAAEMIRKELNSVPELPVWFYYASW